MTASGKTFSWMVAVLIFGGALTGAPVFAQDYPNRPVKLVTPFPPGGGTDAVARIIAEKLTQLLQQPVVVENRAGAGGSLGTKITAAAAADGYTLVLGSAATHAVNPSLYSNVGYDPIKDFDAISPIATTPLLLLVKSALPVNSVAELIALSKQRSGNASLNYGSAGTGSAQHLGGELFKSMAHANILHVPYKGAGPAMNDLLGGHIDMVFDTMPSAMPQLKSPQLKALGVSSLTRNAQLPSIPAISETVPGFEMITWYGLFGPKGMPKAVVQKLNSGIKAALDDPAVQSKFMSAGITPSWSTSEAFASLVQREVVKWREVIEKSGAKID
jgi:tripartite-type tricarboxylate transporter receptor subunit TctC